MSQCDRCKHALVDVVGKRAVLVTCRNPATWPELSDVQTCPGFDIGAPVHRHKPARPAAHDAGNR